jgi:hypothetical protein
MQCDLRMTFGHWQQLQKLFQRSFRSKASPEVGAIGILGRSRGRTKDEYLLADLLLPKPEDFTLASNRALTFSAGYIRRAHVASRQRKLAGIIMFHTHPLADDQVRFSPYDDQQEPQLHQNLVDIEPTTEFLSVVAGKISVCGRRWIPGGGIEPLGTLYVVGDVLLERTLDGEPPRPPAEPSALFDRSLPLTGSGALARLSRMKIVTVGASGTGSIAVEVWMRAGCRDQEIIDHDVCKDVNGGRILHSSEPDCANLRPKVQVLKKAIESLGFGCRVEAIKGNLLDRRVLMLLRDADLIFGCVDAAFPRQLMCKFAYQYLRPYIDVGSEIGADKEGVVALNTRANYIAPGRWCLQCAGIVTDRQLRFESKTREEREREAKLGYSDDLVMEKPAVMDLNMRATTLGTMLLRHLLQPFLSQPIPVTILENLVTLSMRAYPTARNANPDCPICQKNLSIGFGDCGPELVLHRT